MKMNLTTKRSTLILIGLAVLTAAPVLAADAEIGAPAPDFTLTDTAGEKVSLSDFDGKVRVLEWVNPDCPFVQRHYKAGTMTGLAKRYADDGVVWLTVNSTHYMDAATSAKFADAYGVPRPILVDADGTVGHLYGAKTTPHMFIVDTDGTLVYAGAIDDDPRGTRVDDATNHVAAALDEVLAEVLAEEEVSTPETQPYGCSVKYGKR
jgi:peroxiredoxin